MDHGGVEGVTKRARTAKKEGNEAEVERKEEAEGATETIVIGSEEMEMNISRILERINRFTERVSEMLDAGKTMFKDMSVEFEERMIRIHREHVQKWEEEIKQLRMLDAVNEEAGALLHNAQYVLQSVDMGV